MIIAALVGLAVWTVLVAADVFGRHLDESGFAGRLEPCEYWTETGETQ